MLKKALVEETIQGLSQGVVGGWKRSIKGNNSACNKGIRSNMIQIRGPHTGNKSCLISPSNLIATKGKESWRIYESKLRTMRLS